MWREKWRKSPVIAKWRQLLPSLTFYCFSSVKTHAKLYPKGQVSFCYHLASVRPSLAFFILIFSSETTGPIWTKLGRDGLCVVPFQNCVRRPHPPTKMAAMAKNRKFCKKIIIKNLLVWNCLASWDQTLMEWSLGGPFSELCPMTPPVNQDSRYQPT